MKKILLFLLVIAFTFSSCSTSRSIGNGAYSDVSLVRDSDGYELRRLQEVNSESRAIFGIPLGNSAKKEGVIVRFNGINVTAQKKIWPVLSMIALSVATGSIINEAVGYKTEDTDYGSYETDEYKLGLALSSLIAVPVAGAINNQIWSNAAYSNAAWNANSTLLEQNPDIDVFLNPKYDLEIKNGFWSQKVKLRARVMGATLLTDE